MKKKTVETKKTPAKKKVEVIAEEQPHRSFTTLVTDFTDFLREQGVISLSIAVVLGAAVTKLVGALVTDLINPIIGVLVGAAGDLASMSFTIGPIEILWGHFLAVVIDFMIVASVIYLLVRILKLDRLDKKKA